METGGGGAKPVGGPPVHGLYDHNSLSPTKASTPIMRGKLVVEVLRFIMSNSLAPFICST